MNSDAVIRKIDFAVAVTLSTSFSASFWTGFVCYGLAFLAFWRAGNGKQQGCRIIFDKENVRTGIAQLRFDLNWKP